MEIRPYLLFLFLILLNISFGQVNSNLINKGKTTTGKNVPLTANAGSANFTVSVAPDAVKLLTDSIFSLNKLISDLKDSISRLKSENNRLTSQFEKYLSKDKNKANKQNWTVQFHNITYWVFIVSLTILSLITIILFLLYILFFKNKRAKPEPIQVPTQNKWESVKIKSFTDDNVKVIEPIFETIHPVITNVSNFENNSPKSFSNINYSKSNSNDCWFVVGASSIGKSHFSGKIPCQDNHYYSTIKNGWAIAVSCDGAGSVANSQIGAGFVAENAFNVFSDFLKLNQFVDKNLLPNEEQWQGISNLAFKKIYNSLKDFARSKNLEFNSLACTVTVVISTPIGLLSTHIGDGRAGYCNASGQWKSLLIPHKGEEANQTIFLTSSPWISDNDFKMSGVSVPESRVIAEKANAFTLLSDGCENHSFDCSKMDYENNKWVDPNLPYDKFFNPLLEQLKQMHDHKVPFEEVTENWIKFIEEGTPGLKEESDDKTLILGILI